MANDDFSYVFDFGSPEYFAGVKSAQVGVPVDIVVTEKRVLKCGK